MTDTLERIKVYRLVRPVKVPMDDTISPLSTLSDFILKENDLLDLRYFPFIAVTTDIDCPFFDFFQKAIYDDGLDPTYYSIAEINLIHDKQVYDLTKPEIQTRFNIVPGTLASVNAMEAKLILVDREINQDEIVKLHSTYKEFPRINSFRTFQDVRRLARAHGTLTVFRLLQEDGNPDHVMFCNTDKYENIHTNCSLNVITNEHDARNRTQLTSSASCIFASTNYQACYFKANKAIHEKLMEPDKLRIVQMKIILDDNVYTTNPSKSCRINQDKENIRHTNNGSNLGVANSVDYGDRTKSSCSTFEEVVITRSIAPYEIINIYKVPNDLPKSNNYRNYKLLLRSYC